MIQTHKLGFTDKGQIVYLHRVHWQHRLETSNPPQCVVSQNSPPREGAAADNSHLLF